VKELKKALDTFGLHDIIKERQAVITLLRSQEERDRDEKLELRQRSDDWSGKCNVASLISKT